jgi:FkbM family methyltransferase
MFFINKLFWKFVGKKDNSKVDNNLKSYSQMGEDRIILNLISMLKIETPSYIDIGAYDPYCLSNTALLYSLGCTGINIEPNPHRFKSIAAVRTKDINLNIGVYDKKGVLNFNVFEQEVLSCFDDNMQDQGKISSVKETIKVEVDTLKNIITKFNNGIFPDIMFLDAEGIEKIIIDAIDFSDSYPKIICVETLEYAPHKIFPSKNIELIDNIKSKGYFLFADTYINSIFVRQDFWIENRRNNGKKD